MRIFDEKFKCSTSSLCIEGTRYSLAKANVPTGSVFVFTVDEPNKERDQIFLTLEEMKALFLLITSNEEKK